MLKESILCTKGKLKGEEDEEEDEKKKYDEAIDTRLEEERLVMFLYSEN